MKLQSPRRAVRVIQHYPGISHLLSPRASPCHSHEITQEVHIAWFVFFFVWSSAYFWCHKGLCRPAIVGASAVQCCSLMHHEISWWRRNTLKICVWWRINTWLIWNVFLPATCFFELYSVGLEQRAAIESLRVITVCVWLMSPSPGRSSGLALNRRKMTVHLSVFFPVSLWFYIHFGWFCRCIGKAVEREAAQKLASHFLVIFWSCDHDLILGHMT